jgi:hypothetical protein
MAGDDTLVDVPAQDGLERVAPAPLAKAEATPPTGQLGAFALLGAAASTVPLPWLPDALSRRLRGALVQDIAARHGRTLTPEARTLLGDPSSASTHRGPVRKAFRYLGRKMLTRFGPLALLPTLRGGLETYVLGYLFDRYLSRTDRTPNGRLEVDEARHVLRAIDRAVIRVASPDLELAWPRTPAPPEELRDELTQALDGLLSATTTVPSWLLARLAAAFDEVMAGA